ncbi:hypothetical protein [Cumulibacter soli]|uniref:hypothetical protein n=1 Tax=Cumulibacter soli TaxID=2546344 RepID=UPI0010683221|nr:hypothetical protein [Cumulibacter soli]
MTEIPGITGPDEITTDDVKILETDEGDHLIGVSVRFHTTRPITPSEERYLEANSLNVENDEEGQATVVAGMTGADLDYEPLIARYYKAFGQAIDENSKKRQDIEKRQDIVAKFNVALRGRQEQRRVQ